MCKALEDNQEDDGTIKQSHLFCITNGEFTGDSVEQHTQCHREYYFGNQFHVNAAEVSRMSTGFHHKTHP